MCARDTELKQSEHINLSSIFISISHNLNTNFSSEAKVNLFNIVFKFVQIWKQNHGLRNGSLVLNKLPNIWCKRIHGPSTLRCPDDPKEHPSGQRLFETSPHLPLRITCALLGHMFSCNKHTDVYTSISMHFC